MHASFLLLCGPGNEASTCHTPTNAHTQVVKRSQYLLLQTACPDALVRLEHSSLAAKREELLRVYFQQHHGSLEEFLAHHLQRCGTQGESLLMQVGWVFVSLVPSAEKGKISAWCLLFVHASSSHGNLHTTPLHWNQFQFPYWKAILQGYTPRETHSEEFEFRNYNALTATVWIVLFKAIGELQRKVYLIACSSV